MGYAEQHMREAVQIIEKMDLAQIEKMADLVVQVKAEGGRIFFLGVGGSAGNCSHAVNDFRKIVGIECYAPTDNVSELTARTNDEGWATVFVEWLKISKLLAKGCAFHFFGRRRQSREEHQSESCDGLAVCQGGRSEGVGRRRPGRWLYRSGCRRLRYRAHRECRQCYATFGSISGRRLASFWSRIQSLKPIRRNGNRQLGPRVPAR